MFEDLHVSRKFKEQCYSSPLKTSIIQRSPSGRHFHSSYLSAPNATVSTGFQSVFAGRNRVVHLITF